MAHLALTVDHDPDRRDRFVANLRRLFEELPGTTVAEERHGECACVWAIGPHAPVSLHRDADGFALLVGYGIDDDGRHISARELFSGWLAPTGRPQVYDGYYVGVSWSRRDGLAAGVDPLGMFPFHYANCGSGGNGPLVAATTPEALRCHPSFDTKIDRLGLAGILMVHGPLFNRPLLAGSRRLAKGHLLRRINGGTASEQEIYRVARTKPPAGETPSETEARIADVFINALRRHRPHGGDASIMLSGGLDSRLVAAGLAKIGAPAKALVLGRPDDFEVVAGSAVARRLGMPLETVSTETVDDGFPTRARALMRFNHLTAGPAGDDFAEGLWLARSAGGYVWSGIVFDWAFEPVSYAEGYDAKTGGWALGGMVAYMNRWGAPVARLSALLGGDGAALCEELIAALRAACLRGPDPPEIEACRIRWDQRIRNQIATACHRMSFYSWPLMPGTDRQLNEAMLGLPVPAFEGRAIEKAILRTLRPDLCEVPLDTNSFRFDPVVDSRSFLEKIFRSSRSRLRRLYWKWAQGRDPRRYERIFNVDHPRWMALRREVEPLRPLLHRHLDPRSVAELLPAPDVRTNFKNPVNSGGVVRLLVGLAVVLENLDQSWPTEPLASDP